MSPEIIQQISSYLEDTKIQRGKFTSFREFISHEELKEEGQALQELLINPSTFTSEFTKRCQNRAKRNGRSFLSFISSPEGSCNALYWNIAKLISNIESLRDLIKLMSPEAHVLLRIEYSVNMRTPGKPASKTKLSLIETSLETLRKLPAEPKLFKYYTATNHLLFDIREISDFDFQLHSQFFKLISHSYPKLAKQLYQHNHQFVSLLSHIKQESKRQTPRETFLNLNKTLQLGGETYTKNPYASPIAQTGYMLAKEYLESLSVKFRNDILALKINRWSNVSVQSLFLDLADGKCIETVAEQLNTILENSTNRRTLDTYPTDSNNSKNPSLDQEQYPKSLSPERVVTTLVIPAYWQKKLFPTLRIRTVEAYLNSLFTFPPTHYESFLRHAIITPKLPQALAVLIAGGEEYLIKNN